MNLSIEQVQAFTQFDRRLQEAFEEFEGVTTDEQSLEKIKQTTLSVLEEFQAAGKFPSKKVGVGLLAKDNVVQLYWITEYNQYDNLFQALFEEDE
jgi:hypothetical protein